MLPVHEIAGKWEGILCRNLWSVLWQCKSRNKTCDVGLWNARARSQWLRSSHPAANCGSLRWPLETKTKNIISGSWDSTPRSSQDALQGERSASPALLESSSSLCTLLVICSRNNELDRSNPVFYSQLQTIKYREELEQSRSISQTLHASRKCVSLPASTSDLSFGNCSNSGHANNFHLMQDHASQPSDFWGVFISCHPVEDCNLVTENRSIPLYYLALRKTSLIGFCCALISKEQQRHLVIHIISCF